MLTIKELPFEAVSIKSSSSFDGLEIMFQISNQEFQFFIGNKKSPFPLSVKHIFKEKEICSICSKTIAPYPVGQQLCMEFQKDLPALLQHFQKECPEVFNNLLPK